MAVPKASMGFVRQAPHGNEYLVALIPIPGRKYSALRPRHVRAHDCVRRTGCGSGRAVLVNQLVASYVPAIPGWFATRHLIRKDEL